MASEKDSHWLNTTREKKLTHAAMAPATKKIENCFDKMLLIKLETSLGYDQNRYFRKYLDPQDSSKKYPQPKDLWQVNWLEAVFLENLVHKLAVQIYIGLLLIQ